MSSARLVAAAAAETGYLEKRSNAQLDSKTANAGSANWTKYSRDYDKLMGTRFNGQPWCAMFISMMFVNTFGFDTAKSMIGGNLFASCSAWISALKARGQWLERSMIAHPGDIIFFSDSKGAPAHAGLVTAVGGRIETVEGNTSSASGVVANGGAVARKSYAHNYSRILGYGRPNYNIQGGEDKSMNTVKGSTANETKMIKAIQTAVGTLSDGLIGTQTMSDIARIVGAKCFPLTLLIYSNPCIICNDIIPFSPKTRLSAWSNTINGSFLAGVTPWSILVQDGYTIRGEACHSDMGYPESVIYQRKDGTRGIKRVKTVSELPDKLQWAVGGCGMLDFYNPAAEGFRKTPDGKDYSDVLRQTNHAVMGVKGKQIYLCYVKNKTGAGVNSFCKTMGFDYAIMLDGGSRAAIHGDESFAKINTGLTQYYAIQGI